MIRIHSVHTDYLSIVGMREGGGAPGGGGKPETFNHEIQRS